MKRTIYLIAFLLLATSSFAQKVIDLGDVDFLERTGSSVELKFLKKHSDTVYTQVLLKTNDGNITVTIDTISSKDLKKYYNLTPVKDMKPMGIAEWNDLLVNKSYCMQENRLKTFTTHNEHIMSMGVYYGNGNGYAPVKKHPKYNYSYSMIKGEFYNYLYLKLQEGKYIVAVVSNYNQEFSHIEELIVPYASTFNFLFQNKSFAYTAGYEGAEPIDELYTAELKSNSLFKKVPTINGKFQLISFLHHPTDIVGDSITFHGNNIVAYNNETQLYDIYTGFGEKLPFVGLRAVKYSGMVLQLLLNDNTLSYMHYNSLISQMPQYPRFVCGTVPSYADLLINQRDKIQFSMSKGFGRFVDPNLSPTIYTLEDRGDVEAVYFGGGGTMLQYTSNELGFVRNDILYVKKKSGKWNVANYKLSKESKTFAINQLMPNDCDSLVMQYPVYFYQDGLVGCYPYMESAGYKSLEANDNFLRYEDSKGVKGWLEADTLKEHPDL